MKKIFIVTLLSVICLNAAICRAEDIKEYSFSEFYEICSDIEKRAQTIRNMLTWEEKFGVELGSKEKTQLEQIIFYSNFMDDLYDKIVKDYSINRNDEIIISAYVSSVHSLDSDADYVQYEYAKHGIRVILTDDLTSEERREIWVRSFEDETLFKENEIVTIKGTFLRSDSVNDVDYLYDCEIIEIKENENPYYDNWMLYNVGTEIIRDNLGIGWYYPSISTHEKIYINNNDHMAEVSSYAYDEHGNVKKWVTEFTYTIDDEGTYNYNAFYIYVDGYAPYGKYKIID